MKVNFEKLTKSKFKATCNECGSEAVKFDIVRSSAMNSWGNRIEGMKVALLCTDCENEWQQEY